jgi:hypothetical protein
VAGAHAELRAGHEPDGTEAIRIGEGWKQLHGRGVAGAPYRNPDANIAVTLESFDTEQSPLLSVSFRRAAAGVATRL